MPPGVLRLKVDVAAVPAGTWKVRVRPSPEIDIGANVLVPSVTMALVSLVPVTVTT